MGVIMIAAALGGNGVIAGYALGAGPHPWNSLPSMPFRDDCEELGLANPYDFADRLLAGLHDAQRHCLSL